MCHRSFSWISWIDRWHTDSQQCSEPPQLRPQTAPAKAAGGRKDYYDFEAPLLTMLLVLASQALTDWTRRFDPFWYRNRIDLYLGPVRCFVTPEIIIIDCWFQKFCMKLRPRLRKFKARYHRQNVKCSMKSRSRINNLCLLTWPIVVGGLTKTSRDAGTTPGHLV